MKIQRTGSAVWSGGIKDGRGAISVRSGALDGYPYGFASRFEGTPGSNPEELLGAAHAACFTMALSLILGEAGLRADNLSTAVKVSIESVEDGFAITALDIDLQASVPGASAALFGELAEKAKLGCPVSKVLSAPISLAVTLHG